MNIRKLARKDILGIKPYKPGRPISGREIKLASNESPLGPPKKAQDALRRSIKKLSLYPEGTCAGIRNAAAGVWGLRPENIIAGNGSNEIIELILHAFLNEGEEVITARPSFLVYALSVKVCGGRIKEIPLKFYRYDLKKIASSITRSTKIIFIANPNNPTGTIVDKTETDIFMKHLPAHIITVFDEAYGGFADQKRFPKTVKYIKEGRPIIMLRTFSKIYGLAGLRIGYAAADASIIELLNKVRQPFNVNSAAQYAAEAALADTDYRHKIVNLVRGEKQYLYREFYKMGLFYVPSEANFVLVRTGSGKRIFGLLLKKGIIVREMSEYGMPDFIRVTVGTRPQNRQFIQTLKEVI